MSDDLEALAPEDAVKLYVQHREGEISSETLKSHTYRLEQFAEWCEDDGIHNLNNLTGRDLHRYRVHRQDNDGLKPVTLQGQLSTLRVFLQFCASIDAVEEGLHEKILLPHVSEDEQASRTTLDPDRAREILEYLKTYHYANREHVVWLLLWRTGIRLGSARSIDLDNFDRAAPALELEHSPEQDTPLKNKSNGERWVALDEYTASVIDDYIEHQRIDQEDEYGREPLLTTREGRVSRGSIRREVYKLTRPCVYSECPHDDYDPETCIATEAQKESQCPSARSPHDVRSGSITAHLLDEVPVEVVSDRMDVSQDVLDRHYDRRSEREKMEQRREFLNN
jgi:site-specific recombinase XerD